MTEIKVFCPEENKIVGSIEIEGRGVVKLDGPTLLRSFQPVSDEYRFRAIVGRSVPLQCPKCRNSLSIGGTLKTFESSQKIDVTGTAIIVGVTKVGVE